MSQCDEQLSKNCHLKISLFLVYLLAVLTGLIKPRIDYITTYTTRGFGITVRWLLTKVGLHIKL